MLLKYENIIIIQIIININTYISIYILKKIPRMPPIGLLAYLFVEFIFLQMSAFNIYTHVAVKKKKNQVSSEILVHIVMIASHSCCRFVGCTSMMRISRSTTSQRCSIGLRSGDCGGHLSKVNSLSCSRNQSEMI